MEVKTGFKRTEVGVIPEDWEVNQLIDVCKMKSGAGITSANIDQVSEYPCYGGNGIRGYSTRFTHNGKYALIGRQGALCGNVRGVEGKFFASEHAVVVTPLAQTDINWLTYILDRMNLNQYSESSAQPGLSVSKLLKLTIASPSKKAEQEAIAEVLSDADVLIEGLEQLIAKKGLIKQGAMRELLTGKKRLPEFSGEWTNKSLEELIVCLDNLRIPLNGEQRLKIEGDYPYCGANGILDYIADFIIDDDFILIAEDGGYFDEYATRPIAYRMSGKCWVNNHAHILKAKDNIDQDFVYYSLVHKNIMQYLASGTRAKLNKSEMYKIVISIPNEKPEQTAIADVLNKIDEEIDELQEKLRKINNVKQGMMQELLTGRIRIL